MKDSIRSFPANLLGCRDAIAEVYSYQSHAIQDTIQPPQIALGPGEDRDLLTAIQQVPRKIRA
jgi:hypothetical protein